MKYKVGDVIFSKSINTTFEIIGIDVEPYYYSIKFVKGNPRFSNSTSWSIESADKYAELDQAYLNETKMKKLLGVEK